MLMLETLQANIAFTVIKTVRIIMTKLYKQIGEEVVEFTEADYAQLERDNEEATQLKKDAEAKLASRAKIIEKLGLTEDEIAVLLG